ncbi:hypothetical protein BDF20DRAFT_875939 [Mycotypha africana]|uniref:uncharacterized protein n=1 Tax=Mycotypha africana TaxID=64632 RepID=UPI002300BAA6|nr:uncharacterized protein BDF20DRAFT_875939 [Mycotypha africana]KAI8977628.1 hypothetical protein BDF20DRAFT_875939 [Mycotypha africana]
MICSWEKSGCTWNKCLCNRSSIKYTKVGCVCVCFAYTTPLERREKKMSVKEIQPVVLEKEASCVVSEHSHQAQKQSEEQVKESTLSSSSAHEDKGDDQQTVAMDATHGQHGEEEEERVDYAPNEESQQRSTENDFSQVITAIQESVQSNISEARTMQRLSGQDEQDKKEEENQDTCVSDDATKEKREALSLDAACGDKGDEENIMAASAPSSPRPRAVTMKQVDTVQNQTNSETLSDGLEELSITDEMTSPTRGIALNKDANDDDERTPSTTDLSENQESQMASNGITTEKEEKVTTTTTVMSANTNDLKLANIDYTQVKENFLSPRAQERFDHEMLKGVRLFFNNKFSEAKQIFERRSTQDPLYALGLGSMAFIQAITSYNPKDVERALSILTDTYHFANAQIEAASAQKPFKDTVSHYITNLMGANSTNLPTNTRPFNKYELQEQQFLPNGALRAHVIKAECALLMAMLYLSMETMVGYLKAGLNLRRAYSSYSLVWQEYKRMGQHFHKYMDDNTVSAIQFGIGSVHLLLSSLPPKILKIVSAFGWKADKHLGFALLKVCLEEKRIRSPLASLMLVSYYVLLTSYAPQILVREFIQPAIECLLDAQQNYANSAFFLFFAGRVSRLARNIPLSTQSFSYMHEVTQGDWAETTLGRLATYEMAVNAAMGLDWASAAARADELQSSYNAPAYLKFFYGACMEMMSGKRTEAILAFAEARQLMDKKRHSEPEQYVANRVAFFELSGYQDLEFSLPALELLFTSNAFPCMAPACLEQCLTTVDETLNALHEREQLEYDVRKVELVPETAAPDYYDQRGTLLLLRASLLNALGRYKEGIPHLNWVIDNREKFKHTKWLVPFAYW